MAAKRYSLVLYTAVSAGFVAGYAAWLIWRRPRLLAEREACLALLKDIQLEDGDLE